MWVLNFLSEHIFDAHWPNDQIYQIDKTKKSVQTVRVNLS